MSTIEYLDRPPAGWFAIDVMKVDDRRKWDWCALMIDAHPDDLKNCRCKVAWLYIDPREYRPGSRTAREAYVRVPGKHRNKEAAWDALQEMLATRH